MKINPDFEKASNIEERKARGDKISPEEQKLLDSIYEKIDQETETECTLKDEEQCKSSQ